MCLGDFNMKIHYDIVNIVIYKISPQGKSDYQEGVANWHYKSVNMAQFVQSNAAQDAELGDLKNLHVAVPQQSANFAPKRTSSNRWIWGFGFGWVWLLVSDPTNMIQESPFKSCSFSGNSCAYTQSGSW